MPAAEPAVPAGPVEGSGPRHHWQLSIIRNGFMTKAGHEAVLEAISLQAFYVIQLT